MRKHLLALAALSVLPFQIGCDFETLAESSNRFREDFQYTYNLKPGGRLSVDTFNGSVEIMGWEKNSVQITGTKYASREEVLKQISIETKADDESVAVQATRPQMRFGSAGAKFIIRAPRQVRLERINSSNGQIRIEDIQGNANMSTSNGGIRLRGIEGRVDARTTNGGIECDMLTGDATLRTSNGGINLDRIAGALDAATTNAGVHVRLGKPAPDHPIHVESTNGGIELEVETLENNEIRASTSNAGITLRLPASIKARLRASTSNSSVASDFDVSTSGSASKNRLEGDINGGGPLIDVSTSNGSIRIQKLL